MSNNVDDFVRLSSLVLLLNTYRDKYYNESESLISDREYDKLYDELVALEEATGVILSDSPTQSVGYVVKSKLDKVTHDHPMLSLDKTKDIEKVRSFLHGYDSIVMAKMDGLTCSLRYEDGVLVRAETRGDGVIGEDITHNMSSIMDVPKRIRATGVVVVDGELIITRRNFEKLKDKFVDNKGKPYKNPRNLASGSVRLLDSKKCAERKVQFVAWRLVAGSNSNSFHNRLYELLDMGFNVVPHFAIRKNSDANTLTELVESVKSMCDSISYPIDGCVLGFDDIKYGESLGTTAHHARNQIAYKFYDDLYTTTLREVDWTMGKTGVLCPTAIFDTVEIDGTEVSRASMHNITIMKQLGARIGCTCEVFKANAIIPQIDNCVDDGSEDINIPTVCPICGHRTEIIKEKDTEVLVCTNSNCPGKMLGKLITFVSKQGMDIDGLGESTLEFLYDEQYCVRLSDIYTSIPLIRDKLLTYDGWGETSVDALLDSIEKSRQVELSNFITALSIPNIGKTSAKLIADNCNGSVEEFTQKLCNGYDWTHIEGFGDRTAEGISTWWRENNVDVYILIDQLNFIEKEKVIYNSKVSGKTFCITGTFDRPRSELQKEIESLGCVFVSGVSKKTDILFAGEKAGSKLSKAKSLGIEIITDVDNWITNNK